MLQAIARALQLDPAEHGHLFALAGYRAEDAAVHAADLTEALRTVVEGMQPNPAYLLDRAWNMVAWNAAEAALFPTIRSYTDTTPNLLELVFCDAELAVLMADHDAELVRLVSQFRLHRADWPNDPAVDAVVDRLKKASPRFVALWEGGDVAPSVTTRRHFHHPIAGHVELDHHRLAVLDRPGMQVVIYTPAPGTDIDAFS